jgi:hypothetical protein
MSCLPTRSSTRDRGSPGMTCAYLRRSRDDGPWLSRPGGDLSGWADWWRAGPPGVGGPTKRWKMNRITIEKSGEYDIKWWTMIYHDHSLQIAILSNLTIDSRYFYQQEPVTVGTEANLHNSRKHKECKSRFAVAGGEVLPDWIITLANQEEKLQVAVFVLATLVPLENGSPTSTWWQWQRVPHVHVCRTHPITR